MATITHLRPELGLATTSRWQHGWKWLMLKIHSNFIVTAGYTPSPSPHDAAATARAAAPLRCLTVICGWTYHAFSTVAQTDDLHCDNLHCFFLGFHSRRVADVQKCPEVGDLLTVMRSVLCKVHWTF
jgi:hypothetical protein